MKYPCKLIQDLLPLYYDDICSEESKTVIEQHLLECKTCNEFYKSMCEADEIIINNSNVDIECQKAASFQSIKKKLLRKQMFIVAIAFVLLFVIAFSIVSVLKNTAQIISYEDNISVSMTDNSLIGRLQGNRANYYKIKRVETTVEGKINTYLFFYLSGTKWDNITTSNDVFSEYILCPSDKGAEQITHVFYYTGDYTNIESMSEDELQKIIDNSVLLWSK